MAELKPKRVSASASGPSPLSIVSPQKRDSMRSRVIPGDRSTAQSTFATRDSEVGTELTHRHAAKPSRLEVWWQSVQRKYAFWGRYSVGKLQDFSDYQKRHSLKRTLLLLVATPLPSIVVLVSLLAIPLNSPSLGPSHHTTTFVRSFVSHIGASFCITLVVKQALEFTDRVYSYWRCLLMACLASGTNEMLWTALSFGWRFPIPFRELLIANTWFFWFFFFHYVLMGGQFALKKRRMRIYAPVFTVQFGMFYVFLGLALAFSYANLWQQVLLVVVVPPIKVWTKRLVWKLTKQLDDLSTDVTVCVIEITASMYQCLVMQYALSPLLPVLFFVTDITQAAVEIALLVDHTFLLRGETAFAAAVDIIAHARAAEDRRTGGSQHQLSDDSSASLSRHTPLPGIKSVTKAPEGGKRSVASFASPVPGAMSEDSRRYSSSSRKMSKLAELAHGPPTILGPTVSALKLHPVTQVVDGLPIPRATDARLLTQLLRLLFASEMLLFVEFVELVMALLYVAVFGLAYVLPGGVYIVPLMGLSDQDYRKAMENAGLNLGLETVSFLLVFWLLHRKCGLSTVYQIAYVLENYWMTIQGKIVACLLLLLNLATYHQGTDFTFKFVFAG